MDCRAAHIDGGDSGRGQNHELLFGRRADMSEECGLTCTGFPCQEKGTPGILYNLERILELRIAGVDMCRSRSHGVSLKFDVEIVSLTAWRAR